MTANAKAVEQYSLPDVTIALADEGTLAPTGNSPVADLHRLLERKLNDGAPAGELVLAPLPMPEVMIRGVSRASGVTALVIGYIATAYLISLFF